MLNCHAINGVERLTHFGDILCNRISNCHGKNDDKWLSHSGDILCNRMKQSDWHIEF